MIAIALQQLLQGNETIDLGVDDENSGRLTEYAGPGRRVQRFPASEQCGRALGRDGRRKKIALRFVATVSREEFELRGVFDTLGDDGEIEAVRERDDRAGNERVVGIGVRVPYERAVDLQRIERKALEVTKARVAGAEVVDRERDAERLQLAQRLLRFAGVVHQRAFRDLDLDQLRFEIEFRECPRDRVAEATVPKLPRRQIDRDRHGFQTALRATERVERTPRAGPTRPPA